MLKATVVKSSHMGINGTSSSNELDAQDVQPHQKPKWPHLPCRKRTCLLPVLPCWNAESLSCGSKRRFLAVRSGYTFAKRKLARFTKDHRSGRTSQKRLVKEKANCSTSLKTNYQIKSVTSDIQSVNIHPQRGCLQWPYGTLSESP